MPPSATAATTGVSEAGTTVTALLACLDAARELGAWSPQSISGVRLGVRDATGAADAGPTYNQFLLVVVAGTFLGLFTILITITGSVLTHRGLHDRSARLVALSVFALYALSVVYWASRVWGLAQYIRNPWYVNPGVMLTTGETVLPIIVFGILVALGDGIVWWRVYVLSQSGRAVILCLGWFFPICVFAMGSVVSAVFGARPEVPSWYLPWSVAASGVSFLSNALATSFIAVKAWTHRHMLQDNPQARIGSTRTLRILFLLVESGIVYCVLWGAIFAAQLHNSIVPAAGSGASEDGGTAFVLFFQGCVPMLVAMYPTVIVLLVALQKTRAGSAHFTQDPAVAAPGTVSVSVAIPLRRLTGAGTNLGRGEERGGGGGGAAGEGRGTPVEPVVLVRSRDDDGDSQMSMAAKEEEAKMDYSESV